MSPPALGLWVRNHPEAIYSKEKTGRGDRKGTRHSAGPGPWGLPATGEAALASAPAWAGAGAWPPATSASFPEEFHFLRPEPQKCGSGGGWFLRMTPLSMLHLLIRTLCCHGDEQHPDSPGEANSPTRNDPGMANSGKH